MLIIADLTNFGLCLIVDLVDDLVEAVLDDLEIDPGGFLGVDLDRFDILDLLTRTVHSPADRAVHMAAENFVLLNRTDLKTVKIYLIHSRLITSDSTIDISPIIIPRVIYKSWSHIDRGSVLGLILISFGAFEKIIISNHI